MNAAKIAADIGGPLIVSIVTLALGWLVGNRVGARWDALRKQRELDLRAVDDFHHLYGEFFAIWKLWNDHKDHPAQVDAPVDCQWRLFERSAAAEGGVEALFVKVTSQRHLTCEDAETMGRFRQAFQSLREKIRVDMKLAWYVTAGPSHEPGFSQYKRFKELSAWFARLLASSGRRGEPSVADTSKALLAATSAASRATWWLNPVPVSVGRPLRRMTRFFPLRLG